MNQGQSFSRKILEWYGKNQRPLPWRTTRNPYYIWLSEIILQQTRVAQGTSYYHSFVAAFPSVFDLAQATEEQVLKLWQGLGYYSRARNLHKTARLVVDQYDGIFPQRYDQLLTLPGVGPYTAAAIASICFDQEKAVVDGNVFRVLSRYFGIDMPINTTKGQKHFSVVAQSLIQGTNPGVYNQAIMEFGALTCKPQSPDCSACPLTDGCWALQHQQTTHLPVKLPKKAVKNRYFNYLVPLTDNGHTIFLQRTHKDIWHKLYEFPLVETHTAVDFKVLCKQPLFPDWIDSSGCYLYNEKPWVHKLTHQHIHAYFWIVPSAVPPKNQLISIQSVYEFPVHRLIDRFLHKFFD